MPAASLTLTQGTSAPQAGHQPVAAFPSKRTRSKRRDSRVTSVVFFHFTAYEVASTQRQDRRR